MPRVSKTCPVQAWSLWRENPGVFDRTHVHRTRFFLEPKDICTYITHLGSVGLVFLCAGSPFSLDVSPIVGHFRSGLWQVQVEISRLAQNCQLWDSCSHLQLPQVQWRYSGWWAPVSIVRGLGPTNRHPPTIIVLPPTYLQRYTIRVPLAWIDFILKACLWFTHYV